jgi:hypothetical protein
LAKTVRFEKQQLKDLAKVELATKEEAAGVRATGQKAKELQMAAQSIQADIRKHLNNRMLPHDKLMQFTNDLGETKNFDDGSGSLSADTAKIEKQNQQNIKADLKEYKLLEQAALAAANLVVDGAKVSQKESVMAANKDMSIEKSVEPVIAAVRKSEQAGLALEKRMAGNQAQATNAKPVQPSNSAHKAKKPAVRYEDAEDEDQDLGESEGIEDESTDQKSTLKKEQFALVNAESKLNQAMANRKKSEEALSKKLSLKEKTAVQTAKLNEKAQIKEVQDDADKAVRKMSTIDQYLVKSTEVEKQGQKVLKKATAGANIAVHDSYIAEQSLAKVEGKLAAFSKQGTNMLLKINDSRMQRIVKAETNQAQHQHKAQAGKVPTEHAPSRKERAAVKKVTSSVAAEKAAQKSAQMEAQETAMPATKMSAAERAAQKSAAKEASKMHP